MDDKIKKVIKKIISDIAFVDSIEKDGIEYYFNFKKHPFSISVSRTNEFLFFLYPAWRADIASLVLYMNSGDIEEDSFIKYVASDDQERELLSRLYTSIKHRFLNVDAVLDDILDISSDEIPF